MEKTVWQGRTASGGKALGKLFMHFHQSDAPDASEGHSPKERERFFKAVNAAKAELSTLTETAKEALGEKESDIFLIHSLFLEDEDFLAAAERADGNEGGGQTSRKMPAAAQIDLLAIAHLRCIFNV